MLDPTATPPWGTPSVSERLRVAWQRRNETDYIFNFSTALGWSLLTCGIYSYYVFFQLMRRSRDHNERRRELLDAATSLAWEHAQAQGVAEELRTNFQQISDRARILGDLATDFRDPFLWVVFSVVTGGLVQYVGWVLIDIDLVKHETAERLIEAELVTIYARLGQPMIVSATEPVKGRHNVAGRIVATIASFGFYSLWWLRDLMVEGNLHLEHNWQFEDQLARAAQSLLAA